MAFEPTPSEVIALAVVMPLIAISALVLRIYVKCKNTRFAIDDCLISASTLFLLIIAICAVIGASDYGYGKVSTGGNLDDGPLLVSTKKTTDVIDWMAPSCFGLAKLSVLFFYRSIFRGTVFNILTWTMIVLVSLWTIAFTGVVVFQCGVHVHLLWSSGASVQKYCAPGFNIAMSNSATDAFFDLAIICIPIYWTLQLHMSLARKVTVCATFMFGALTSFSSIGRLIAFSFVYPGHNNASNQLGYFTVVAYFTVLEASLTIIACCLPTFGPLVHRGGRLGSTKSSGQALRSSTYRHGFSGHSVFSSKKTNINSTTSNLETSSSDYIMGKNDPYHKLETFVSSTGKANSDRNADGQITTVTEFGVDEITH